MTKNDLFEEIISKIVMRQGTHFEIGCVCCGVTGSLPPILSPPSHSSFDPFKYSTNISDLEAWSLLHGKFTDSFFKRVGFDNRLFEL